MGLVVRPVPVIKKGPYSLLHLLKKKKGSGGEGNKRGGENKKNNRVRSKIERERRERSGMAKKDSGSQHSRRLKT